MIGKVDVGSELITTGSLYLILIFHLDKSVTPLFHFTYKNHSPYISVTKSSKVVTSDNHTPLPCPISLSI